MGRPSEVSKPGEVVVGDDGVAREVKVYRVSLSTEIEATSPEAAAEMAYQVFPDILDRDEDVFLDAAEVDEWGDTTERVSVVVLRNGVAT